MKEIVLGILAVALFGGLIYFGPDIKEHFGTRYADADREIFQNSKPFINGQIQNIQKLKIDYELAENPAHKAIIKRTILETSASLDRSKIPHELQSFLNSL